MHQKKKSPSPTISHTFIFSNKERMHKAITALVEDPQNNLRIFQNGLLIYGENKSLTVFHEIMQNWLQMKTDLPESQRKFCQLLSAALLKDYPVNETNHICANLPIEATVTELPNNCVLKRILLLQQLDLMGPQLYSKAADSSDLDLWKYIDYLLEEIDNNKYKCAKCALAGIMKKYSGDGEKSERDRCLFFVPYLLACVARDCSIMLSFSRVQDDLR